MTRTGVEEMLQYIAATHDNKMTQRRSVYHSDGSLTTELSEIKRTAIDLHTDFLVQMRVIYLAGRSY